VRIDGYFDDQNCPRVRIQAATGQVFDAVINTAFNADLWMPKNILMSLGFVSRGTVNVEHADGRIKPLELFAGNIIWFGQRRRVSAVAGDGSSSYVGMGILTSASLRIRADKRLVYIEAPFEGENSVPST
jgi:predicted aspartyl protease